MKPAMIRVVTRNGRLGTAITSSASISSLIRIAPSWAVKPSPTVADRARCGDQRGDLTGVEVGREEAGVRADAELFEGGVTLQADLGAGEEAQHDDDADGAADDGQRPAAEYDLGQQPHRLLLVAADACAGSTPARAGRSRAARRGCRACPTGALIGLRAAGGDDVGGSSASRPLRRDDLEVHGRDHEVDDEQQHERDDHGLVDRVADAFGPHLGSGPCRPRPAPPWRRTGSALNSPM